MVPIQIFDNLCFCIHGNSVGWLNPQCRLNICILRICPGNKRCFCCVLCLKLLKLKTHCKTFWLQKNIYWLHLNSKYIRLCISKTHIKTEPQLVFNNITSIYLYLYFIARSLVDITESNPASCEYISKTRNKKSIKFNIGSNATFCQSLFFQSGQLGRLAEPSVQIEYLLIENLSRH